MLLYLQLLLEGSVDTLLHLLQLHLDFLLMHANIEEDRLKQFELCSPRLLV